MIRISNIKTSVEESTDVLLKKACQMLNLKIDDVKSFRIIRRSLDARKKPELFYVNTVELVTDKMIPKRVLGKHNNIMFTKEEKYRLPEPGRNEMHEHPIIVGSGPAGLFAAYVLALRGYAPAIYEMGDPADVRTQKVQDFWDGNGLDLQSNVQFGEGGAGTFSDGKLNTGVKDPMGRKNFVLENFVRFGAPEEILYDQKPHLGTDVLANILPAMRHEIERLGGHYYFRSKVTDIFIKEGKICGIEINGKNVITAENVILAIGHSSRDTYHLLKDKSVPMQEKAFAVGVRIEHPQSMIDVSQYGRERGNILPPSPYKLTHQCANGRGVYSFCMCPGGHVVNSSSEEGRLCINGMSYQARNSENANSALIVTVTPEDYRIYENSFDNGVLAGLAFQRTLEKNAYDAAMGLIPVQLFEDFKNKKISKAYGDIYPVHKGSDAFARVDALLPSYIRESLVEGIDSFGFVIKGYDRPDALISGVEARTSSPVRILRNSEGESEIKGLYPCGEGAGFAGGIMSAAMDGMKIAESIIRQYQPPKL